MSLNETMTALADEIRQLSGTSDKLGLDDMADTLNTENTNFESNLNTQEDLINQISTLLTDKGVGGGGATVETCSLMIQSYAPASGNEHLYYINSLGELVDFTDFPGLFDSIELLDVVKNSIICTAGGSFYPDETEIQAVISGDFSLFHVIGDEPTLIKSG